VDILKINDLKQLSNDELLSLEKETHDDVDKCYTEQIVKKTLANSLYGAIGNCYCRWYDIQQAEAITLSGQMVIKHIGNTLNKYLNDLFKTEDIDYLLYTDTDSCYLTLDELVKRVYKDKNPTDDEVCTFLDKVCKGKLEPLIAKTFTELENKYNYVSDQLFMKREAIALSAIWVSKKRYILSILDDEGVRLSTPKIKAMGLELKKSSTPSYCRDILTESVDKIFNGTEADVIEYIDECRKEFKQKPFEEIAFPRGVNDIGKWSCPDDVVKKCCPIHVRGSLYHNRLLAHYKLERVYKKISAGDKIKYIYLKVPNPAGTHVIAFSDTLPTEFNLDEYMDYNKQFEKAFLMPLRIILDAISWSSEHVNTLEGFFE